ncbi:MAG: hypothetical protein M1816_000944 [Peltula sp. TS41687]|nr:MAG: hypothetical protein M1816_000944 [Peltula sp. TS41687]
MPTKPSRFTEVLPPPATTTRSRPRKLTSMSSISSLSNIFSRRRSSNHTFLKPSNHTVLKPSISATTLAPSTIISSSPTPPFSTPAEKPQTPGLSPPPLSRLPEGTAAAAYTSTTTTTTSREAESTSPQQRQRHRVRAFTARPSPPVTPRSGSGSESGRGMRRKLENIAEATTTTKMYPQTPRKVAFLDPPVMMISPAPRRQTLATTTPLLMTTTTPPDDGVALPSINIRQITGTQPPAYWAGRFSALNDRFRNEEMDESCSFATEQQKQKQQGQGRSISIGGGFRRLESKMSLSPDERRVRRVFIHLNSLCATEEARDSLKVFQEQFLRANKDMQQLSSGLSSMAGDSTSFTGAGGLLGAKKNRLEKNAAAGGGGGGVRVFKKFLSRKSLA